MSQMKVFTLQLCQTRKKSIIQPRPPSLSLDRVCKVLNRTSCWHGCFGWLFRLVEAELKSLVLSINSFFCNLLGKYIWICLTISKLKICRVVEEKLHTLLIRLYNRFYTLTFDLGSHHWFNLSYLAREVWWRSWCLPTLQNFSSATALARYHPGFPSKPRFTILH